MDIVNPYNDGRTPVFPGSTGYVSRPEVLQKAVELREKCTGLHFITAPRKSGKSSALLTLMSEESDIQFVRVDLSLALSSVDIRASGEEIIFKVLRFILRQLKRSLPDLALSDVEHLVSEPGGAEGAGRVVEFLQGVDEVVRGNRVAILLDEIENIGKYSYVLDDILLGFCRAHVGAEAVQFATVTTSLMHPSILTQLVDRGDLMSGSCLELKDFSLDRTSVQAWCHNVERDNWKEIVSQVLQISGGQPAMANALLYHCFEENVVTVREFTKLVEREVERIRRGEGLHDYVNTSADVISSMTTGRLMVLDRIEQLIDGDPIIALTISDKEKGLLETTGLVRLVEGLYVFRAPLLNAIVDRDWTKIIREGSEEKLTMSAVGSRKSRKTRRPRLLLVNYGGTIGMVRGADDRMEAPESLDDLLSTFPSVAGIADFVPVAAQAKDGINIGPRDWVDMARFIFDKRDGIDGAVILHGTDTMAYAASAVAYQLGSQLNFPVVFTGAQLPYDVDHTDAEDNFRRACVVAGFNISEQVVNKRVAPLQEVVIAYHDQVFRAVRAEKRDDFRLAGFHSPTSEPLAEMTEPIQFRESLLRRKPSEPGTNWSLISEFESNIFKVALFPGLKPKLLDPFLDETSIKAIVLQTPGVGNVPTEHGSNLIKFIRECHNRDLPVAITHQIPISVDYSEEYLPAAAAYDAGAINTGNMSEPAAMTKIMWALPQIAKQRAAKGQASQPSPTVIDSLRSVMSQDYILELARDDLERNSINQAASQRRSATRKGR